LPAPQAITIDEVRARTTQTCGRISLRTLPGSRRGQTSGPNGDHQEWSGYLVKDGRYVTITTQHSEQALIAIARSLRRVP
jgi:hypothetical protein